MQKSDYRAFNAVFCKVACVASVLKIKRLPVSLYGLKSCPLTKTQLSRWIISVKVFSEYFNVSSNESVYGV